MGKRRHDRKGRSKGEGQYIRLPYSMLRHPAWRSLSPAAIKVWLELRSRYNGSNNGRLALSVDQGAKLLGMSKSTVTRALRELEAKGFIVKTKQGHWYGRQATEWRVTDQPYNGYLATRDWQKQPVATGKTNRGTHMKHVEELTVPPEYRSPQLCSATVPVRGARRGSTGTEMGRLYITTTKGS